MLRCFGVPNQTHVPVCVIDEKESETDTHVGYFDFSFT